MVEVGSISIDERGKQSVSSGQSICETRESVVHRYVSADGLMWFYL